MQITAQNTTKIFRRESRKCLNDLDRRVT